MTRSNVLTIGGSENSLELLSSRLHSVLALKRAGFSLADVHVIAFSFDQLLCR